MAEPDLIEYQVRKIERYIVTRFERRSIPGSKMEEAGSEAIGTYDNWQTAYDVAYACCKVEHDRLGWPPGDERIQYPRTLSGAILPPEMHEVQMAIDAEAKAGNS